MLRITPCAAQTPLRSAPDHTCAAQAASGSAPDHPLRRADGSPVGSGAARADGAVSRYGRFTSVEVPAERKRRPPVQLSERVVTVSCLQLASKTAW